MNLKAARKELVYPISRRAKERVEAGLKNLGLKFELKEVGPWTEGLMVHVPVDEKLKIGELIVVSREIAEIIIEAEK